MNKNEFDYLLPSLFGAIAGNRTGLANITPGNDFIPVDGSGGTLQLTDKGAVWLGLQSRIMQKYAYDFCYPFATVVDRLAEADTNGIPEFLRSQGKGKEDLATNPWATRMNKLFEQPNVLQGWEQFRGQQQVYKRVFGFCPVLPLIPAGFESDPSYAFAMINLPPWLFDVKGTKKMAQDSIEGLVEEYTVYLLGKTVKLKPGQVMILEDSFMQDEARDFLLPQSRLVGLDMAISNICAANEADNVLLRKKGPLGFISHDAAATKDAVAGYVPMTEKEKQELQGTLRQYGLSWHQFQYAISRQPVRWNSMSYSVKELGTKETVIAGIQACCQRYGYSYTLYTDSDATYANQAGAHKGLYQNTVIPSANKDARKYAKYFKAAENQCKVKFDFSHLPILQEDEAQKATARKTLDDALTIEYSKGLVTKNQWLQAIGLEGVTGGDTYIGDNQGNEPLAIKLGVGGTEALMALLSSPLPAEAKVNGLQILFGLTPEDAKKMVGEEQPPASPPPPPPAVP